MVIVIAGNIFDGFTFHGPFRDHDEATEWAEKNCEEWSYATLDKPDVPAVAALSNVWDTAVEQTFQTDDDGQVDDTASDEERQTWYENDITQRFARIFMDSGREL